MLETDRMQEVVKRLPTISEKIRALDEAGFARTEIARFLGKRYQHVRNVLVAPRPKKATLTQTVSGNANVPTERRSTTMERRVQIGAGGRLVIPADMRAIMGVSDSDILHARVVDGELRLISRQTALHRAQELVRQYVPKGVSLVDELIAERRTEARRENGE